MRMYKGADQLNIQSKHQNVKMLQDDVRTLNLRYVYSMHYVYMLCAL